MYLLSKIRYTTALAAGLISVLAGCALAPGMHMEEKYIPEKSVDAGITATLKFITPKLVQDEKKLRDQQSLNTSLNTITPLIASPVPYLIGSGDILAIVVWDHPELSTPAMTGSVATISTSGTAVDTTATAGFVVDQDGLVQFPYVGTLKLSGLTESQARTLLLGKLARVIKKPDLTLRVQAYRSKRIYVDGEIKTPGVVSINDLPMTLPEALSRAGGFLPTSDQSQIEVSRTGTTYRVNLPQLLQNKINPASILLNNGDMVRIVSREESKIFVLGEVMHPVTLLMRNGHYTLNEALGDAGGLNQLSAEGRQVYVVRNVSAAHPVVYNLDARSPVAMALAENFELKPKDVVYVDASKLANWSRVVNLIIPSAQSVISTVQTTK